jgi:hypothetical protein
MEEYNLNFWPNENGDIIMPISRVPMSNDFYCIKLKKINDEFYCELSEIKKLLNEVKFL